MVFIDETWAKTNMSRTRGRALFGQRLVEAVPHGHWATTTILMGLRSDGLVAPMVIDGSVNGEIFLDWVEKYLCAELRPNDIVILDNLPAHKVDGVAEAIKAAKAKVRYLPPYSPDLNPIEQLFSKIKSMVRSEGKRTIETLWSSLGKIMNKIDTGECRNFIKHCGYRIRSLAATVTKALL
jgi:transposase